MHGVTPSHPGWIEPLVLLLPAAAAAVLIDAPIARLAGVRRWADVVTASVLGNIAGWIGVVVAIPAADRLLYRLPGAVTAHPIKRLYLHIKIDSWRDVMHLAIGLSIGAAAMWLACWLWRRRRRPGLAWLPVFAGTELAALIGASVWSRWIG